MPTKRETFTPTLRAQYLGQQMRELRDDRGLTLKYVAGFLGVEFSTLARYERAEWPFRKDHVVALLDVYGVYAEGHRQELTTLATNAWRIDHWDHDGAVSTDDDWPYIGEDWLDQQAEHMRSYHTMTIPELLQTTDYARALIKHTAGRASDPHEVERVVYRREQRQREFGANHMRQLTAVIEEAVLHRRAGGTRILQQQLEHLIEQARRPDVTVHVLPTSAGAHDGVYGTFTVYHPALPYPPVARVEHLGGTLTIEAGGADRYAKAHSRLLEAALRPEESTELIDKTNAQLTA